MVREDAVQASSLCMKNHSVLAPVEKPANGQATRSCALRPCPDQDLQPLLCSDCWNHKHCPPVIYHYASILTPRALRKARSPLRAVARETLLLPVLHNQTTISNPITRKTNIQNITKETACLDSHIFYSHQWHKVDTATQSPPLRRSHRLAKEGFCTDQFKPSSTRPTGSRIRNTAHTNSYTGAGCLGYSSTDSETSTSRCARARRKLGTRASLTKQRF